MLFLASVALAADKIFEVRYTPGASSVTLKIIEISAPIYKFEILNLIGRRMKEVPYEKGQELVNINDIGDMQGGLYVIVAKDAKNKIITSVKFMINK
jgi:hypothetical protein